jgi:hypothetical protein
LIKFVSISTRYGGTRAVLYARKNEDATWGLSGCVWGRRSRSRRVKERLATDLLEFSKRDDAHSSDSVSLLFCFLPFLPNLNFRPKPFQTRHFLPSGKKRNKMLTAGHHSDSIDAL